MEEAEHETMHGSEPEMAQFFCERLSLYESCSFPSLTRLYLVSQVYWVAHVSFFAAGLFVFWVVVWLRGSRILFYGPVCGLFCADTPWFLPGVATFWVSDFTRREEK